MTSDLRARAQALLNGEYPVDEVLANEELPLLLQELRIYQVELQLQNEELQKVQAEVETARQKYFDYYELAPVGYITLDEKGIIQDANLTARNLLVMDEKGHITGKPFMLYVDSVYQSIFYDHLQLTWRSQTPQTTEIGVQYRTPKHRDDHEIRFVQLESVVRQFENSPQVVMTTLTNITQQKKLEQELREKSNQLTIAQRQARLGYWWWDFANEVGGWSEEVYKIFKYDDADQVASTYNNFLERIHPDDRKRFEGVVHKALRSHEHFNIELKLNLPDNRLCYVQITNADWQLGGNANKITGIIQDMTELYIAQEDARKHAMEQTRMAILKNFITEASHEFRTPLTILQSSLELVYRKSDIEFYKQRYPRLLNQITQIERIIDTMLLSSRLFMIDKVERTAIDMTRMIDEVKHSLRHEIAQNSLTLNLEIDQDITEQSIQLNVDENLMSHALYELLHNSIRFSDVDGMITIHFALENKSLRISIKDHGIGIEQNKIAQLTEAFYRIDKAHSSPGIGLGLTIVAQVVDLHQGKLAIESTPSEGTTVHLILPPTNLIS